MTTCTGFEFAEGDVLRVRTSPRVRAAFRMRITRVEYDDAANLVLVGPQLTGDRAGRLRRTIIVSDDDFTIEEYGPQSTALLAARTALTAAEVRTLGRVRGSKWSNMADWYTNGWIRPAVYVMCRLVNGLVKPVIAGATRDAGTVCSWGAEQDDSGERWVLTNDGATRLETWLAEHGTARRGEGP